jgi:F0F1-type ATP synthase assembly protein I
MPNIASPTATIVLALVLPTIAAAIAWRVAGARFVPATVAGVMLGLFLPEMASAAPVPLAAALGFGIAKFSAVWS